MHFESPADCAMHQAWNDAAAQCIETGGLASELGGLAGLGASRNYVERAHSCIQFQSIGIWGLYMLYSIY